MKGLRQPLRLVFAALFVVVATLATNQITHDLTATVAVLLCTGLLALAWIARRPAYRYYRRRRG
jgi:hypothetical protein